MAIYRNVMLSFWTDNKVEDDFTPEDKYFYLYLLTNPQTNICGCYEISYNQISRQTGYNKETIDRLFARFEDIHKIIKYNRKTKEILVLNWYKYNWSKSKKTLAGVNNVAKHIKSKEFREYVESVMESFVDRESAIFNESDAETVTSDEQIHKKVIDYLNEKCGTRYRCNSNGAKQINDRIAEGYKEQDFFKVIDKKYKEWHETEWEKFLTPHTLFGEKFDSYLSQKPKGKRGCKFNDFPQRNYDFEEVEREIQERQLRDEN